MKIVLCGAPGSGKSTVGKLLAEKLRYEYFSAGNLLRSMAKDMGIALKELEDRAKKDSAIDRKIDEFSKKVGQTGNDFVIDSHIAFHFIPDAVKIFLDVDEDTAARRIFNAKRPDEKQNISLAKTKKLMHDRQEKMRRRFMRLYNVDYMDKRQYDVVIDTTANSAEQVVNIILRHLAIKKDKGDD